MHTPYQWTMPTHLQRHTDAVGTLARHDATPKGSSWAVSQTSQIWMVAKDQHIVYLFIFCWWWALVLLSGARGELGRNLPCKKSQCNARKKQGKAEGILQQQSASEINASPAANLKKLSVVPHHPVDVDTLKLPKHPVNITVLHPSQPVGMFKRNLSQRHTLVLTSKSCSVHLRQRCLHRWFDDDFMFPDILGSDVSFRGWKVYSSNSTLLEWKKFNWCVLFQPSNV